MGLPVACVQKMKNAVAAIRITVLTTPNVKTENVPWERNFQAVMPVKWIVKEGAAEQNQAIWIYIIYKKIWDRKSS